MAPAVLAFFVVLVIVVAALERARGRRVVEGGPGHQFQNRDWATIVVCTLAGFLAAWLLQDRLLQADWRQISSKEAEGMMPEMLADEELSLRVRTAVAALLGGAIGGGLALIGLRLRERATRDLQLPRRCRRVASQRRRRRHGELSPGHVGD